MSTIIIIIIIGSSFFIIIIFGVEALFLSKLLNKWYVVSVFLGIKFKYLNVQKHDRQVDWSF